MSIIENAFDKDNARSNRKRSSSAKNNPENIFNSDDYKQGGGDVDSVSTTTTLQDEAKVDISAVSKVKGETLQDKVKQKIPLSSRDHESSAISTMLSRSVSLLKRNARDNTENISNDTYNNQYHKTQKNFNEVKNRNRISSNKELLYIDSDLLKKKGMVSHSDDFANPIITNEYRLIKHRVLSNIQQLSSDNIKYFNMLMMTSINPSEGKTFSAINMALSIASEKNNTILLVDANTHNPSICSTLGVNGDIGLIDFLLGNVNDISDVIFNTNIPNLKIIPTGSSHHLSNELLSSVKMQELSNELSSRYSDRVVIFDCPPLLGVVETATISKLMGQAIIVVEHLVTKFSDVEQGISEIKDNLKTGFIVNKTIGGTYSQYGHGYEKKIPNS